MADIFVDYSQIKTIMQSTINDVRTDLSRVTGEMQAMSQRATQQGNEVSSGLQQHTSRISSLEQQVTTLTQQLTSLEAQLNQINSHLQNLNARLSP